MLKDDHSDEVDQIMQATESYAANELEEVLQGIPAGWSIWNED